MIEKSKKCGILKKVEKLEKRVHTVHKKNRITLYRAWVCTLECGHIETRIQGSGPTKLKCSTCS